MAAVSPVPDAAAAQEASVDTKAVGEATAAGVRTTGRNINDPRVNWTIGALVLTMLVVGFCSSFEGGGGLMDEGMLLVYPELVQKGAVPYRDFETFYGPANLWVLSAIYAVFGVDIGVERTVGLIYRLLILGAIFGVLRRWGTALAAGCAIVTGGLLITTGVAAYSWMGGIASALLAVWIMTRAVTRRHCLLGGFMAGLALLFRVDLGPAVLLSSAVVLWGLSWRLRFVFACGAAAGLLPLVGIGAVAGAKEMINNLFLFPVIYCNPGRRLPLWEAEPHVLRLFFGHLIAVLINLGAGVVAARAHSQGRRCLSVLALAVFGAAVTHQAYQRPDYIHVAFAAFLSIGLLPASFAILTFSGDRTSASSRRALITTSATVLLVCIIALPVVQAVTTAFISAFRTTLNGVSFVEHNGRSFPVGSANYSQHVAKMLEHLERVSAPGDRLFVGPGDLRRTNYSDTFIYHLTPKLRPATYFLEMNPFSANRPDSRLAADIQSADWLVLNRMWDSWREPNRSQDYGSEAPNMVVRESFVLIAEYGPYGLFRRKP